MADSEYDVTLKNDNGDLSMDWQGCCSIKRVMSLNSPQDINYIHICNVPELIEILQTILTKAKALETWEGIY